jgi:hypothetical protein
MNHQSSWPRRKRVAAIIITITIAAGLALLTAACGSSPSSTDPGGSLNAGGSASSASAHAWIQCVRAHGVPDFPGLDSSGNIPKITSGQQVGVSDSQFSAAQAACQALWPYQAPTQAQQRQELADDLKFAECMRSHGLPNFPDPTTDPQSGRVEFALSVSALGGSPQSPQIQAKARVCQQAALPPGSPLPSWTEVP